MSESRISHNARQPKLLLPGMLFILSLVFGLAMQAQGEEPYGIDLATAKPSAYLPASIVDGIDPQGSRLFTFVNGLKTPVCEVWWAKDVATRENPGGSGKLLYGNLTVGEFVGVIHYLAESSEDYREDFNDQKLRPGYYTLRYGNLEDPEHKSQYKDFLVLSPVSVDRDPSKIVATDELSRMSRIASRSKNPAIISMVPLAAGARAKDYPGVRSDDAGTCIFDVKLHVKAEKGGSQNDLAIALILVTPLKENGAS
jgi:hypothetical protein